MPNTTYLRLFPAVKQFELKNGALNVGGRLFVYYEETDDLAEIFDEDGSRLQQPAILDNDGRALGLFVDAARVYRLEVQDAFGAMQFTVSKMSPSGGGAGSALGNQYDIISSDRSITVDKYDDAGVTKFDLGIAPQSDEFLEWIKCSEENCGSTWIPVYQSGTMETTELGIKVHAGQLYHFTNTFTVDPDGTGINYDTFQVLMYLNDQVVDTRKFDIDSSLNDAVQCEFSHDLVPSVDGFVSFKLTIPSTCEVAGEVQCHRIYSGINAIPDTCATKQWVQETFDYNMAEKISYSALGYNASGDITGISGSSIAGGNIDATAYVPWSASGAFAPSGDYAYNSSLSSKADQSSLTAYQPVSAMSGYATESYVDSAVSGKLDVTASSMFITSLPADLATTGDVASAVSGKLDSSASSSFYPMTGNPSGFLTAHQSLAGLATESYVDSAVSGKLDTSAYDSAQFQQASAMSSWIPYSALDYSGTAISGIGGSSLAGMGGGGDADYTGVYPVNVDNTAREISVDSLPLVTDSSLTAYGSAGSSVIGVNLDIMSGKLDSSAQVVTATATQLYAGTAYLTSVNGAPVSASRAGQAANASMANSAYYDGTGRLISSLPDSATVSAIASAYTTGKQDTLTFAYNTANQISSINGSALGGMDEAAVSGIASAYAQSAASSKLDSSAFNSGDFYSTANPSGFITGVDLSPYQTTAGMSSYIPTSMSSDFQQASAMSSYALSSDVSATVDLVSTQSANWGGSALALSAGPGISLTLSGNTLVASTDLSAGPGVTLSKSGDTLTINTETVLWSGTPVTVAAATAGLTLAESPYNFDRVALYWVPWNYTVNSLEKQEAVTEARITSAIPRIGSVTEWNAEGSNIMFIFVLNAYFDASKFYTQAVRYFSIGDWTVNTQGTGSYITKIVGISRTAEA